MINIEKNMANDIVLTLSEKATLVNPYWLFEFRNDLNQSYLYFTASDFSQWKGRYNEFTLTETGSTAVNLTAGTINLLLGKYTYKIYEQNSPTNISPSFSGVVKMVETGLAIVYGEDDLINDIYK